MKKVGNLAIALIISVITTFSLVSCENDGFKDTKLIENTSDSEANTDELKATQSDDGLVQYSVRRSSQNDIKPYNYWYRIDPYHKNIKKLFNIRNVRKKTFHFLFLGLNQSILH